MFKPGQTKEHLLAESGDKRVRCIYNCNWTGLFRDAVVVPGALVTCPVCGGVVQLVTVPLDDNLEDEDEE